MPTRIVMQNKIDDFIAFMTGDVAVTILALFHFNLLTESVYTFCWTEVVVKISLAIFIGFFGGAFGLFGKDFYIKYVRNKFMKRKDEDE